MAISNTAPAASYLRGGKRIFPFNVTTKQVTDSQTGQTRTQYEYEEWEVGADATDADIEMVKLAVERKVQAKKDYKLLTALASKTDQQIVTYIQNNVTDLASAKNMLVLLARAVGMLARSLDIED